MTAVSFGLLCLSSLVTIIDPVAAAPIFLSVTSKLTPSERRATARRACLVALGLLVVFAVAGSGLLKLFGITLHAFRIAGGFLFFSTGAAMLAGKKHAEGAEAETDLAIVPLGMPVICGPGALATVMVLMGQAIGFWHHVTFFLALLLAIWVTYVCLLVAPAALRIVGKSGVQVATQVMGLILCVLGVQFIVDGIRPLLLDLIARV
jgi:multiple antibiotic resistance protein